MLNNPYFRPIIVPVFISALLAASALGCAAQKPQVAHVKGAVPEGHAYRTYALVKHPVNIGTIDSEMSEAVADAMQKAGYQPAEDTVADLHMQYGMLVSQNPGAGHPHVVMPAQQGSPDLTMNELLIASDGASGDNRKVVVIMAGERATNRVVWIGVASDDVADGNLETAAVAAVEHVMATFPVRDQWDQRAVKTR